MTSDNPVSNITEGFASATVKLGIEGIRKLVDKFKNRKIAFVQDEKTLEKGDPPCLERQGFYAWCNSWFLT